MIHKTVITAAGVLLILAGSCGSVSKAGDPMVSRVSANTQVDLSGRWNDTDVRTVCDSLLNQAFASAQVSSFIRDYIAKNNGNVPTVILGNFRNTSSEHIDTGIISGIMRTAIINSGRLEFVESGGARDDLRAERRDQQGNSNEATAARLGYETGANLMLSGTVRSIVDRAGNTTVRSYFVTAALTNIETSRILWEGDNNEIKKIIRQPKIKF